jgi:hypothetical protein
MDLIENELSEAQLRVARLIAMGMGYKDVATDLGVISRSSLRKLLPPLVASTLSIRRPSRQACTTRSPPISNHKGSVVNQSRTSACPAGYDLT